MSVSGTRMSVGGYGMSVKYGLSDGGTAYLMAVRYVCGRYGMPDGGAACLWAVRHV